MRRLPFLPTFFVTLSAVFLVALAVRIRSYEAVPERRTAPSSSISEPEEDARNIAATPTGTIIQASPVSPPERTEEPQAPLVPHQEIAGQNVPSDEVQRVISSVWFEPRALDTGDNDALHLLVRPGSQITKINGVLRNWSATAHLPFTCTSRSQERWDCRLGVPSCVACGRWSIERLQVTRGSGVLEVPSSHPLIARSVVNISASRCDSAPPAVHVVTVAEVESESGDVVLVFTVADGYCGVAALNGTAVSSVGQRLPFSAVPAGDENTWTARLNAKTGGSWKISSLEVSDTAGNFKTYSESDPVLKNAAFGTR